MKRLFLGLIFLVSAFSVLAEDVPVSITPKWNKTLESDPRNKVTVVFQHHNNTEEPLNLVSELELPPGWKTLFGDTPLPLQG